MFCIGAQRIAVLAPGELCATLAKDIYQATVDVSYQRGIIPVTLSLDGMHLSDLEIAITRQAYTQLSKRVWRDLVPEAPHQLLSLAELQKELFKVSNGWFRLSVQVNLPEGNTSRSDYQDRVFSLVTAIRALQRPPSERTYPILNEMLFLTPQTYRDLRDIFVGERSKGGYGVIEV